MSERKKVNFSTSPPRNRDGGAGSSRSGNGASSSSRHDPASDLGGSRASSRADQWDDLVAAKEHWKSRAQELEKEVSRLTKQVTEVQAKWQDAVDRNEQLEDDYDTLAGENDALVKEVDVLKDDNDSLREDLAKANARINEMQSIFPLATPAMPGSTHSSPPPTRNGRSGHNLQDENDSLREDLAKANARFNEMQSKFPPSDPPVPAGSSSSSSSVHRSGSRSSEQKSTSSSARHRSSSKDARGHGSGSSSHSNGSSHSSSHGSSHSSGHSSHSSSRAKVGSGSTNSSTSTARASRQVSSSKHDHESAKDDQMTRLAQRFNPKASDNPHENAVAIVTTGATSPPLPPVSSSHNSSSKHHKNSGGNGGNGSSTSNGSSATGADGGGGSGGGSSAGGSGRPPARNNSLRYVEPFGPGGSQRPGGMLPPSPVSPNKGVPRTVPQTMAMMPPPTTMAPAGTHYGHGHGPVPTAATYSPSPPVFGGALAQPTLVSPRGDLAQNGYSTRPIHPAVTLYDDVSADAYRAEAAYYTQAYAQAPDPRLDPRLVRR